MLAGGPPWGLSGVPTAPLRVSEEEEDQDQEDNEHPTTSEPSAEAEASHCLHLLHLASRSPKVGKPSTAFRQQSMPGASMLRETAGVETGKR